MKQTTRKYLGIAAATTIVIGVTTGVLAHGGYGPGMGSGWAGHQGMMGGPGGMHGAGGGPGWVMGGDPLAYADQQLTGLKMKLGITTDQESTWKVYKDAVKGKAAVMLSHRQTMMGSSSMTPEQRFAFHQQGLDQMQTVNDASRDLYSVLTPEQQTSAGNLFGMYHGLR